MILTQALEKSHIIVLEKEDRIYYMTGRFIYLKIKGTGDEMLLNNSNDWPILDNGWKPMAYDIENEKVIIKT